MTDASMFDLLANLLETFINSIPYLVALYLVFDIVGSLLFNKR